MENCMKRNEKLFVNLVSNVIIVVIILTVITLGFSGATIGVSAQAQPIYKGENGSNKVSLMFNVYSGNEYLKNILATLKKHNVHATFFVGGCWVEKNSELFLQIV